MAGNEEDGWKSSHTDAWFLAPKEGILSQVLVSPFDIYEILMRINRDQKGRTKLRVGTAW